MSPGAGLNAQRCPVRTRDLQLQGNAALGLALRHQSFDAAGQRRIAVEPHALAWRHPAQIRPRVAKAQHPPLAPALDAEDGASGLVLVLGPVRIEDNPHAWAG